MELTKDDPLISVIMLTYNRQEFVGRAIESILSQTFLNFEFIIIDNGSTDRSANIVREYAAKESRIRFFSIGKHTIGYGRNRGLDKARGDYIIFIDDDDTAEPDMLDFLYQLAEDTGAEIALCGSNKEVDGKVYPNCVFDESVIMDSKEAVVTLLKRRKYNAAMPTKLVKRELFSKIRFFEEGNYDDIRITYRFFTEAKKVAAWGKPKYCFYRHPGNNSAFTTNDKLLTPEQLDEYFEAFRERTKYLSQNLPGIADYALYSEWSYMISMVNKIISNNLTACREQLAFARMELNKHYEEFMESPYIEEFEKEYMRKYIANNLQRKNDVSGEK